MGRLQLRPQTGSCSSGRARPQTQEDRLSLCQGQRLECQRPGLRPLGARAGGCQIRPWTQRCEGNRGRGARRSGDAPMPRPREPHQST